MTYVDVPLRCPDEGSMTRLVEIDADGKVTVLAIDELQSIMVGLSLAENGGDIADELIAMCKLIGHDSPRWSDDECRYVLPWEDDYVDL